MSHALASSLLDDVTPVVVAKEPRAGQVKTRLAQDGMLDPETVTEIAWAMLRCTVHRLLPLCRRLVLAASPDEAATMMARRLECTTAELVGQGEGDLGARLDRIWRTVGSQRPVAFFGIDSPDVPGEALAAIPRALAEHDVAIGPTSDGGYWTLAARRRQPRLLRRIDWGGDCVYDQTLARAREAGLSVRSLPLWHDVDVPEDLASLRRRLADPSTGASESDATRAPLGVLAARLEELCSAAGSQEGGRT